MPTLKTQDWSSIQKRLQQELKAYIHHLVSMPWLWIYFVIVATTIFLLIGLIQNTVNFATPINLLQKSVLVWHVWLLIGLNILISGALVSVFKKKYVQLPLILGSYALLSSLVYLILLLPTLEFIIRQIF